MRPSTSQSSHEHPAGQVADERRSARLLVDADVHSSVRHRIAARLSPRWRAYYEAGFVTRPFNPFMYVRPRALAAMSNAWPPTGEPPGGNRSFLVEQLLDSWGHTYAVLNPSEVLNFAAFGGEYAAALIAAVNDETIEEWFEPEPRFYGSLSVPFEDPDLAVAEIERLGDHPRFVQIQLAMLAQAPLGSRRYWPIYEAAAARGLPVAIHVAGWSGTPLSPAGWHSFYFENHQIFQQNAQDQVASFIANGVFERIPTLKLVLQEGGFLWLLPLMWRMDNAYSHLREHLPPMSRKPSEHCASNLWFTSQPIEEPDSPEQFTEIMEQLDMDDRLLFASDYPHWDFDSPQQALPRTFSRELRARVMGGNALALYERLPEA